MLAAVILAAGQGTRMKSDLPKVLHPLGDSTLIDRVISIARSADPNKVILVVGSGMERIIAHLRSEKVIFTVQMEQRGTAHAVECASAPLTGFEGEVAVLCGDMPLIRPETLQSLLEHHREEEAAATVLTGILEDPAKYGRIVRGDGNRIERIVEFADASPEIREIKEINSGAYIFEKEKLFSAIEAIDDDNAQGEFYLPDAVEILVSRGEKVLAHPAEDSTEVMGVNTPEQLAEAERVLAERRSSE